MTNQTKIQTKPPQAYLEIARSVNKWVVHLPKERPDKATMTPNTAFALTSVTHVFSFMAVEAFMNERLYELLGKSRIDESRFTELTNLPLKDRIAEVSDLLGVPRVSETDSELWMGFCQKLRQARHFMTHPIPTSKVYGERMSLVLEKSIWGEPVIVAERIIKYFFDATRTPVPPWVTQSQEFYFRDIVALSSWLPGSVDDER